MIYKLERMMMPILIYQFPPSLPSLCICQRWENIFLDLTVLMSLVKAYISILFQKNIIAMIYIYKNPELQEDVSSQTETQAYLANDC
jgi:hypothetical protein